MFLWHECECAAQYLSTRLPSHLQTHLLSLLLDRTDFRSPHLVIHLLFSQRLQSFHLQLTSKASSPSENSNLKNIMCRQ